MLCEQDLPTALLGQQGDGFFCFRNFCREESQKVSFNVLENTMNDAEAVGARDGFTRGLPRLDFRKAFEKRARSLKICVALGTCALRRWNHFLRRTTQLFRGCAKTQKILARGAFGAAAANEFHSPVLPHLRATPQEKSSNLAGALDVSSAARLKVCAFDFDGPQDSPSADFLAHSEFSQVFSSAVANGHGSVFENNLVGGSLRAFEDFIRWLGAS
jgi:hypothetical protein